MEKFTKQALLDELKTALLNFAANIEIALYGNAARNMLGLDPEARPFGRYLAIEEIDTGKYTLFAIMSELYDYAIEARRHVRSEWEGLFNDIYLVLRAMQAFDHMDAVDECKVDRALYVAKLANARFRLDDDKDEVVSTPMSDGQVYKGVLSLSEVALLADMDEKSVRNAANPNTKNPLRTFNEGNGTYVRTADARAWLAGRRGFKPTEFFDPEVDRDIATVGFKSTGDLGKYLKGRRELAGLSIVEALAAAGLGASLKGDLQDLEEDKGFYFDEEVYMRLAQVYELDAEAFVRAGYALYEQHRRAEFENGLAMLRQKVLQQENRKTKEPTNP